MIETILFLWFIAGLISFLFVFGNNGDAFKDADPTVWENSNKKQKAFIIVFCGPVYWVGGPLFFLIKYILWIFKFLYNKLGD
jgi:hypothetical protein